MSKGIPRYAAKRDTNEKRIRHVLEGVGANVQPLSIKGCADLLVYFRGQLFLLEIKMRKGKLTPEQIAFYETWGEAITVARDEDQALRAIGAID